MTKAAIIGAGIGGIATAVRLAVKGYDVTVLEANNTFGGKMHEFWLGKYRFDAGPSLFTLPHLVDELFTLAGRDPKNYFTYTRLDPITHYFWPDGSHVKAYADAGKFAVEAEEQLGVPRQQVREALAKSDRLYQGTADTFLHKSLHRLDTYLSKDVLKAMGCLSDLGLTTTMHQENARQFSDPRFVQLLDRFATYNGSDPYQAPGTLNIIPHLEHNIGAFYPVGGIYAIAASLVKLAEELGVQFKYNEPVTRIITEEGKVTGVETSRGTYKADVVVSNMDVVPTYRRLLPNQPAPEKTLEQPRSSSALIFYWGIKKEFPQLHVHNIFFSQDYKKEFEHIFKYKTVSPDPTVYVNITSKAAPEDAPVGSENWFVMVNVPHNQGQDWQQLAADTRQAVLQKLSMMLHTDVAGLIEQEQVLDPLLIESRTSSFGGALYGSSSNNRMAAFLRHPNFSSKLRGLYFCGGSVHPGGGIPLCLLSAKIVADLTPAAAPANITQPHA
ncbi:1-hydroxycarotenoid 3,4-desaturase CrtD [Pontibacter akesuensis]|uniref:Phytoene desaturase n=1 Tax=Pontibacter akesuensis TaxID=388950 RepID=A0A1I7I4C8_9BACT|nr:1-hydroxycarotenoid 3,4-desaturase CrtD [Pontibacter akesuensis]GHA65090.1 diapolycopene oxygenase [Pontibacter akesuensis]SFU67626.1 phytoene desaturase [Pontibacter akesuensis]